MIKIYDIIEKNIAISTEDGQKVFAVIKKEIENRNEDIKLSFEGIDMLISHFLNESIGELYSYFGKSKWDILDNIEYIDIDEDDLELLHEKVIANYKGDLKKQQEIQKKVLDD
jgi:transcriptional regulator